MDRKPFENARQCLHEDLALFRALREFMGEGGGSGVPYADLARKIAQDQVKKSLHVYAETACRAGLNPDNPASHSAPWPGPATQ